MKILVVIFALLTLSLSAVPCCVEGVSAVEQREDCTDEDCENEPCDEACSPFFNCGSCTGFSAQELQNIDFDQEQVPSQKIFSFIYLSDGEFSDSSFRPPRA